MHVYITFPLELQEMMSAYMLDIPVEIVIAATTL